MKQSKELRTAIEAAKAAGKIIMKHYGQLHHIKIKSARLGIVTETDLKAQRKIKAVIRKAFPKALFLAEEDKEHSRISNQVTWVVDPLDGTKNFSRGIKLFSVSIALVKNKKPVVGVILDPSTGDLFYAEKGKGAYLNGKKIHVSKVTEMKKAIFDLPLSTRVGVRKNHIAILKKMFNSMGSLRTIGSAALRSGFLAAGWFDVYIEAGVYPWDIAAGILLLKEAGGKITNSKGKPFKIFSIRDTIVATNGKLHKKVLKELNK